MATRATYKPYSAEFPSSNFPELRNINNRPVLCFDAATDEACYWTDIAPQGLTGQLDCIIHYIMASANSGAVGVQAQIDAGDSFDSVNNSASTTVPGTIGHESTITITLTNKDSIAAGDYFRLSINRDANGSAITDDASGDFCILAVELRDAA
jgi:hypothetical protein